MPAPTIPPTHHPTGPGSGSGSGLSIHRLRLWLWLVDSSAPAPALALALACRFIGSDSGSGSGSGLSIHRLRLCTTGPRSPPAHGPRQHRPTIPTGSRPAAASAHDPHASASAHDPHRLTARGSIGPRSPPAHGPRQHRPTARRSPRGSIGPRSPPIPARQHRPTIPADPRAAASAHGPPIPARQHRPTGSTYSASVRRSPRGSIGPRPGCLPTHGPTTHRPDRLPPRPIREPDLPTALRHRTRRPPARPADPPPDPATMSSADRGPGHPRRALDIRGSGPGRAVRAVERQAVRRGESGCRHWL